MMLDATNHQDRRPILFIAVGRQRVGKTTVLNALVQFLHAHGANFEIWNGDTQNESYNLSLFHPNVITPPSADPEEVRIWLEERITLMRKMRIDAFLDIGGGETPLSRLISELPIAELLDAAGIRLVMCHVIGPEAADLDYLTRFTEGSLLAPEATLIVLNAGLVMSGRNAKNAFVQITQHPSFLEASERGAEATRMPLLSCLSAVTDRLISFSDAAEGKVKEGQEGLSMFDSARVKIWWTRDFPGFVQSIPELWLPKFSRDPEAVDASGKPAVSSRGRRDRSYAQGRPVATEEAQP